MSDLDRMKIFTGTLEKKFLFERNRLKEVYDETSAEDFFYVYREAPLSFILKHSRDIFSETYRGYPFYETIIREAVINPLLYAREREKVDAFISEGLKKGLPRYQMQKYEGLLELLTSMESMFSQFNQYFDILIRCEGGPEFVEAVTDAIHATCIEDKKYCDDDRAWKHVRGQVDEIAEAIFTSSSVYAVVLLGILFLRWYPQYAMYLGEYTAKLLEPTSCPEGYVKKRRGINLIHKLMKIDWVVNTVRDTQDVRFMGLWSRIGCTDVDSLIPLPELPVPEYPRDDSFIPSVDGTNIGELQAFLESVEDDPNHLCTRYDRYRYLAAKIDVDQELYQDYDELTDADKAIYEDMELLKCGYEGEMTFLEWEDDGAPNKVLQSHIRTSKEAALEEEKKEKSKRSAISELTKSNEASVAEAKSEAEIVEKLRDAILEANQIIPADTKEEEERNAPKLAALRKIVVDTKKAIAGKGYKDAAKLVNDLSEAIVASDSTINESWDPAFDEELRVFLEGGSEEDVSGGEEKPKPQKPKEDLATKVQNKALDIAAKDSEKAAKAQETRDKLITAGKAVSQKPRRTIGGIKEFVQKFDKMDENRRKEFMLKPGYRHKIMKNVRNVLEFGMVAQFKLAWIPFLALIKHASRLKNDRIRNELARELDAEIKICEEKISDANAEGDKKSKYELMRIKEKLEAERQRVRTNSKFI